MTDLEKLCENALYDEIRVLEDGKSVVRDVPTGKLYFKKTLDVYNEHVYAYLRDHKNRNVAAIEAFWREGDKLVVIEELIQGRTLEEMLRADNDAKRAEAAALSFSERIDILTQICDGLQFLHSAEPPIIHRDIKASNIMVTDDGIAKIIDYDAAKIYIAGQDKDTMMIGTQGLAAPEQYGFAQSNVRTDLYALGKLIWRMLPGNVDAKRIADKATEMDPKKRYASAEQMKGQIRRIRERASALDRKFEKIPGFDPMNRSHRVRARIALALIAAAVAALVAVAGWRLVLYPAQMAQQIETDVAAIAQADPSKEDILKAVTNFVQNNPYSGMSAAQKKEVRDTMEEAMERCLLKGNRENAPQIRDILTQAYGERDVWDAVYSYAETDSKIERALYADALGGLEELRKSGAADAQEHWEADTAKILTAGRENFAEFMQSQTNRNLKDAAAAYLALAEYESDIPDADVRGELGEKCAEVLSVAQGLREDQKWDEAIEIYESMQEYGLEESTGSADLAELIRETKYGQAGALLAKQEYKEAAAMYFELGDYAESAQLYKESIYQKGCEEKEKGEYPAAVTSLEMVPGYKDADDLRKEAEYAYCLQTAEKPDDTTYAYIEELTEAGYAGASELREEICKWRATIETGLSLSMGFIQAATIRATLNGGPPDGAETVNFEIYDTVLGRTSSWSDGKEYGRGEAATVNYQKEDSSFNLFERTYRVRVYVGGELAGSWEGKFSEEFLK